jgi:hypothetical protein
MKLSEHSGWTSSGKIRSGHPELSRYGSIEGCDRPGLRQIYQSPGDRNSAHNCQSSGDYSLGRRHRSIGAVPATISFHCLYLDSRIDYRNDYSRVRSISIEVKSRFARIDRKAFSLSSLQSIVIPPSVEILGSECFAYWISIGDPGEE